MLTLADFEGLIVVLLVIFILIAIFKKALKFVYFCVAILCLLQVGYMLSQTSLNEKYHLSNYFKYDIITSVKSIWADTDKEQLKEDAENTTKSLISKIYDFVKDLVSDDTPVDVGTESDILVDTKEIISNNEISTESGTIP